MAIALKAATIPLAGDMNDDGVLNTSDVGAFAEALLDAAAFQAAYPNVPLLRGDMNCDASLDGGDIQGFVAALMGP